jgi:hypothetical protein
MLAVAVAMLGGTRVAASWPSASAELLDLQARIEYGFYANDVRIVEGALERLEQLREEDPAARYYEGLADYRLAQLNASAEGREVGAFVGACIARAEELFDNPGARTEAEILAAACSTITPPRAPAEGAWSQRKVEQALARARTVDAENPRLALVDARSRLARRPEHATERVAIRAELEAAASQFQARDGGVDEPHWGEAEALAMLAEMYLDDNQPRAARDMIERALLAAPGYRFALALKERLSSTP